MSLVNINDSDLVEKINQDNKFLVSQVYEVAEHFGFETRNKYRILDQKNNQLFFVAEQQKGFWGFLFRQSFGHWRPYTLHFFNNQRQEVLEAHHPFNFFFQTLEIRNSNGTRLGTFKQRFALLRRKFDVHDNQDRLIMSVQTKIGFLLWNFPFFKRGRQVASVDKKFSGFFTEMATDKDNFMVSFHDQNLTTTEKLLVLVSSVFIDLNYFEYKSN